MTTFLASEKISQTRFKVNSSSFSEQARADGLYRGKSRPFCLPPEYAEQNLFPKIRNDALSHFA